MCFVGSKGRDVSLFCSFLFNKCLSYTDNSHDPNTVLTGFSLTKKIVRVYLNSKPLVRWGIKGVLNKRRRLSGMGLGRH